MQKTNESSFENLSKGVVYTAFGYEYLLMAANSVRTARLSNPDLKYEIVTNIPFDNDALDERHRFDRVVFVERDTCKNRLVKTDIINYTNLELGVFVDCDTEIIGSLEPMFSCLEKFDIALKLCAKPTEKIYSVAPGVSSHEFPEWNAGVIFFRRNERSIAFYRRWNKHFIEEGKNRDQPALAKTIYDFGNSVRILSLHPMWNTFPQDRKFLREETVGKVTDASRVWHYRFPECNPETARRIRDVHFIFKKVIGARNSYLATEISRVEERYRLIGSFIYRAVFLLHPWIGYRMMDAIRYLGKLGLCKRNIILSRSESVKGDDYQNVKGG